MTSPPPTGPAGLRGRAARGAVFATGRRAFGAFASAVGYIVVAGILGPEEFGVFAAAGAVAGWLATVAPAGTDVFVLRNTAGADDLESPAEGDGDTHSPQGAGGADDRAATITAVGVGLVLGGLCLAGAAAGLPNRTSAPLLAALGVLPVLAAVRAVFGARVERDLRFEGLAVADVASDVVLVGAAIPLALAGAGAWSLVVGQLGAAVLSATVVMLLAGRPAGRYRRGDLARVLRFGIPYSAGTWVSRLDRVVNAVVVGAFLGPAAVGQIDLASRIVHGASFAKKATNRVAIVVLARLRHERERLSRAWAEAAVLQLLVVGVPLAAIAASAPLIVPRVFGDEWRPVLDVLPFLALSTVVTVVFTLQTQVLNLEHRNGTVLTMRLLQTGLLLAATLVLVPWIGIVGFGWATLLRLTGLGVAHRAAAAHLDVDYRTPAVLLAALAPLLFVPVLPPAAVPLAFVPAGAAMAIPAHRRTIMEAVELGLRTLRSARKPVTA